MSSPMVLFILERLRHRCVPPPVVLLAFGPGLTGEVAVIRYVAVTQGPLLH